MTQISLPTYNELSEALSKTTLKLHASEAHGLVSGVLAANMETVTWEELITGGDEKGESHDSLKALYEGSARQLSDFLFEFQLLLPTDDESLTQRAEALSLWCQGFLTGLKISGVPIDVPAAEDDVSAAIADLVEIAKMQYEEVVDNEEDEAAYLELVEFVRMAVILIYQELREEDLAKEPAKKSNQQLH